MTTSTAPLATLFTTSAWSFRVPEPRQDRHPNGVPREAAGERLVMLLGQDGRRNQHAACFPAITTWNAARIATSVLPYPTSPQTSRSIGRGEEVGQHLADHLLLVRRLLVGKRRLEFPEDRVWR